jgi:outer membrane receptor for ferrienterochelin and colicins
VKFDASLFYNNVFNLISLQQRQGTTEYSYLNVDRFKSMGLQLGSSFNFKRLFLQVGYNYTARYNSLAGTDNIPQFSYSPEVLTNATYKWLEQKMTLAIFYKYNGKLPGFVSSDQGTIRTVTSDYQIMDATVSRSFFKEKFVLSAGCKNMFNIRNIASNSATGGAHGVSSTSIPLSTGRNYFLKLSLNFSRS